MTWNFDAKLYSAVTCIHRSTWYQLKVPDLNKRALKKEEKKTNIFSRNTIFGLTGHWRYLFHLWDSFHWVHSPTGPRWFRCSTLSHGRGSPPQRQGKGNRSPIGSKGDPCLGGWGGGDGVQGSDPRGRSACGYGLVRTRSGYGKNETKSTGALFS